MLISKKITIARQQKKYIAGSSTFSILDTYMNYARLQEKERILWYLKVILIIPCVVMIPSIFLMSMATTQYVWLIGFNVILFFMNLGAFISEQKSSFFVPLYHATLFLMIFIPFVALLLSA